MMQLLIGMLLGAMATTETGRNIGNQIGDAAAKGVKQVAKVVAPSSDDGKEGEHGDPA